MRTRRLADLEPIHKPGMNPGTEARLRKLSDDELMQAVLDPLDGHRIKVRAGSNRTLDGNTRIREMQRRMSDPKSQVKPDTLVPVDEDF